MTMKRSPGLAHHSRQQPGRPGYTLSPLRKILVEDANADKYFLIGSNLKGLTGYVQEAWQEYIVQISLWPDTADSAPPTPVEILKQSARRLRVPTSEEQVIKGSVKC